MKPVKTDCRSCGGRLDPVLNLGNLALSNFPSGEILTNTPIGERSPLDLCACVNCRLVQLQHTVNPDWMFKDHYWYRSGINETMERELADVVRQGIAHAGPIQLGDYVMDTGANDGTLLSFYRTHPETKHVPRVAYEPAQNLHLTLADHCEVLIRDYFPPVNPRIHSQLRGRVRILTSIAMFYAANNPHLFVKSVKELLHQEGVWIVQFQDLHQMMQATAFDNICHEHLIYYSLESFERLIAPHGLRVIDAEVRKINGGSYRLYVMHEDAAANSRHLIELAEVRKLRQWENGCQDWHALERFGWRVGEVRQQLQAALEQIADRGPIDVYGASTKFNTLAQYCGIDGKLVRQAWERSPEKVGRQTITGIPIVSEVNGRADPPAVLLAGIWQFRESILEREAEYLSKGGTILFPLPAVDVVTQERV